MRARASWRRHAGARPEGARRVHRGATPGQRLRTIKRGGAVFLTVRGMNKMRKTDAVPKVAGRYSLRLPLPLAARLAAWCEMHPQRSRSELVAALLEAGLAQAERAWAAAGASVSAAAPDPNAPIYLPAGPFAEFHGLVQKHHLRLEHELDHDEAVAPSPAVDYLLGEE